MTGRRPLPPLNDGATTYQAGGFRRLRRLVLGDAITGARSVAWTSASMLVSQVILAANGLASARLLGPGGKGISAAVLTWMQLLIWGSAAPLSIALLVNVPRRCGDKDVQEACVAATLGSVAAYVCTVGSLVALVGALILPRTLNHLGPGTSSVTLLALATVPIGMLGAIAAAIQLALGSQFRFNAAQLATPIVMTVVLVGLALAGPLTAGGVVVSGVAGAVAGTLVACFGLPWRKLAVDLRTLRADLRFGLRAFVGSLFRLTNLRLDFLVMSAVLPATELGLYATANNLLLPVLTLPSAVSTLLAVKVARAGGAFGGEKRPTAAGLAMIRTEAFRYGLLSLVGGFILGVAGWLVVPTLLGQAYRDSLPLMWILLPGSVMLCYTTIVTAGAVSMDRIWVGVAAEGSAAAITVALLPLLLPPLEAAGAATASSAAYTTSALVAAGGLAVLRRRLVRPRPDLGSGTEGHR